MTTTTTTTPEADAGRTPTKTARYADRRDSVAGSCRSAAAGRQRETPQSQAPSQGRTRPGTVARGPCCVPPPSQARVGTRSASETRVLALALQRAPIPGLTKGGIAQRWRVGPDTVRKILRDFGVDPGGGKELEIPLTDILLCEGISDPLEAWLFAASDGRKILSADLLTLEEWLAQSPEKTRRDKTKYYRELSAGRLPSIRIGKLHRFRPTVEDAESSDASDPEARA